VARRARPADPQLILHRAGARAGPPHPGTRPATAPTGSIRRPIAIHQLQGDIIMGKYLVGWLLGVPVFVLVILYFFFH
jgi:hypothetical protein